MDFLGIGSLIGKVLDKVVPDAGARAAAQLELLKLQQNGELAAMSAQCDINKAEAGNANLFVSGWRPFVGWVCGAGLGVQFIVAPLVEWGSTLIGHPTKMPSLDMGTLMTLLAGMLGLGGMRTMEKLQNAAGNH